MTTAMPTIITCKRCKGTGQDNGTTAVCPRCKGAGYLIIVRND